MAQPNRLRCPICRGSHVVKNGKKYGALHVKQTFQCQDCGTRFSNHGRFRERFPHAVKQYAISLHLAGFSYRRISKEVERKFLVPVSATSVFRWVKQASS